MVGLVVVLGSLVYYALRVGEWWMRHFIVTRRRVLLTSGVIVRTVTLLPLRRITDLTWEETFFGQILGYGSFRFESAGQDQALRHITFMPDAKNGLPARSAACCSAPTGVARPAGTTRATPTRHRRRRRPSGTTPRPSRRCPRRSEPAPGAPAPVRQAGR